MRASAWGFKSPLAHPLETAPAVVAALVLVASACSGPNGPSPYSGPPIRIVGAEFSFDAPRSLPPGDIPIEFENRGKSIHELVIVRLDEESPATLEGLRREDIVESEIAGKVGPITTGEVERTRAELEPGRYGMACFVTDPEGKTTHAARGMVGGFVVEE